MYKVLVSLIVVGLLLVACSDPLPTTLEIESEYGELKNTFQKEQTSFEITTDKNMYILPVEKIKLHITNNGTTDIGYGGALYLEKLEDGIWYEVPYQDNFTFTDEGLGLEPKATYEEELPLDFINYQLSLGTYRIIKKFWHDGEEVVLGSEFMLVEMVLE
ncbi:immunoglobulin-like domain-containing protein [Ornithinibacillus sp. 179-J 7C1 HS]|uniref:immunoglobulin-like domain-containing protein n=1 Tax=Ornithinibacillus sp. 179-J 7C1 HS TaxID=3142384 RepID=UPI0039A288D9